MHSKRRVSRLFAVVFAMALSLVPLFSQIAYAAPIAGTIQGEWVNQATIKMNTITFAEADRDEYINGSLSNFSIEQINGYISNQALGDYRDGNIGDGDRTYNRDNGDCDSKIAEGDNGVKELQAIKILVPGVGCQDVIDGWDIKLDQGNLNNPLLPGNGNYAQIWFEWVSQNTITRVDGREGQFMANDPLQPNNFFRLEEAGEDDQDFVVIGANDAYHGIYNVDGDPSNVGLENVQARTAPPTPPPDDPNNPDPAAPDNSCEATGGVMAWIVCPVIKMLDAGIGYLDTKIGELLEVPPGRLSTPEMQDAQKRIRNFAYIILVPIMLVMVISTALGFEFISAYTVKKALPRLVIAAIFIAVSPQITGFLIDLTNAVGKGIAGLILQPLLGTSTASLSSILNPTQGAATSAGVGIFAVGAAIVIGPAIIGMLLSYAFVTFVVLFLAFAILGIRQVLILILALLAPLAILSWIFPGNDKLWKIWWGTFTKLLLLFPLIAILIASGKAFASMVGSAQSGILGTLLTVTAYLVPYFFIPAAFKWAGGVFAALTGMVNDRGKGLFDRQKATRGRLAGEGWRDFKGGTAGGKFNPRRAASMTVGRGLGAGWKGRYGVGKTGAAARANQSNAEPEEIAKENLNFGREMVDEEVMAAVSMGNNVDKMMELSHFRDHAGGRAYAESIAARGRAVGSTRRTQVAAAKQLAKSGKIIKDHGEARALFASASGGDAGLAGALKGNLQYTWRGVGRNDIGRDDIADSLSEMSVNDMSRMKPLGAEGMFDDPTKIIDAISSNKLDNGQREHAVTLLHAATNSPYLNPKQQASVRGALEQLEQSPNMVMGANGQGGSVGQLVRETRARAQRMQEDENQRAQQGQEGAGEP